MWKDFFYFSKRERNGIIILIVFLLGIFVGKSIFSRANHAVIMDSFSKTDTVFLPEKPVEPDQRQTNPIYPRQYAKSNRSYREHTSYDRKQSTVPKQYTPVYSKTEKYAKGTLVNINRADTAEFKKIPGIGSAYASRIIKYRQRLGGFYSVDQIREVYGIEDDLFATISQWMKVENDSLAGIPVNRASLEQLKSHPYINFYQAKAIIELRKRKGKLNDLSELKLLEEFSETDLERLSHYLLVE